MIDHLGRTGLTDYSEQSAHSEHSEQSEPPEYPEHQRRSDLEQLLRTVEPTTRSVLVHRVIAAAVAVAITAAVVGLYVADPLGWFADDGAAGANPDPLSDSTISSVASSSEPEPGAADRAEPSEDLAAAVAGLTASAEARAASTDTPVDALATAATAETARYVDLPTYRLVDTRADDAETPGPLEAGAEITADLGRQVPETAVAVVLSVNVAQAQGPGPITVSTGGEPITAIDVAAAGQMTTNLILIEYGAVPASSPLTVATAGGGHVVVDIVGYFEPVGTSASGRFIPVPTQRLARLVTEVDGREAVIRPLDNPALPASGVSSVLVRISADVGADGGVVRLGEDLDGLSNTMMWAATSGDDRTRQGVALVSLSELDELAFTYNGGSVLDLDVLGYFTDDSALDSTGGLLVPATGTDAVRVNVAAGEPTPVDVADLLGVPADQLDAVFVNVSGSAEQAARVFISDGTGPDPASPTVQFGQAGPRFGVTATAVNADGEIVVTADNGATLEIRIPAYFAAESSDS